MIEGECRNRSGILDAICKRNRQRCGFNWRPLRLDAERGSFSGSDLDLFVIADTIEEAVCNMVLLSR
eukprot:6489607-Amphidinium_carterae.1